ncbi:MAG TPA: hypothetical protein PKC34_10820 [Pseudomonadales bacterium]|nr:hypothetical protein [Pseudomonadales bacterium]HMW16023.1 hypothetical protein [Pseudomonadales bacterium]HMZ92639.1 hypothetical protein [Pseudomonadales bacterium]HNH18737.1 hypothetical protein [Pseudomonadales bacterium]HNN35999.1 hypothetical protein [Pseudomonadales bacterium]
MQQRAAGVLGGNRRQQATRFGGEALLPGRLPAFGFIHVCFCAGWRLRRGSLGQRGFGAGQAPQDAAGVFVAPVQQFGSGWL